jgi:hypothetical protein
LARARFGVRAIGRQDRQFCDELSLFEAASMTDRTTAVDDGPVSGSSRRGRLFKVAAFVIVIGAGAWLVAGGRRSGPNVDQLRERARAAAEAGQWREAQAALSQVAESTDVVWLLRATAAQHLNENDAAAGYLAKIPPGGPLDVQVALVAARVESARFHARPLERAATRALQIDPKLVEVRWLLVSLYGAQGRKPELLEQLAALSELSPPDHELLTYWCIAHEDTINDAAKLKLDLERFVENDPEDRWSRLGLANAYRRLVQFDRARHAVAPLAESDVEARAARAEIELDRGNLDAAASLLADGPETHAKLARLRGRLALNRHDATSALRSFRLADAAERNHWETLFGLAQALRLVGDPAAAEPYARRAEAHRALRDLTIHIAEPGEPPTIVSCRVAAACEAAGYVPEARAWYRFALSRDPLHEPAQKALFRLSAAEGAATSLSTEIAPANR